MTLSLSAPSDITMNTVFGGKHRFIIPNVPNAMALYRETLMRVVSNMNKLPRNLTRRLAQFHDVKTREVLKSPLVRPEAHRALLSHIDLKDKDSYNLQIVSMSDIGAFFEYGVKLHDVWATQQTVSGDTVGEWMDSHGFPEGSQGFVVGKPGTVLDKANPLMFMGKGFDHAWSKADQYVDVYIKKI